MKKVLCCSMAIICTMTMAFSAVAATPAQDAFDLYAKAVKQLESASSVESVIKIKSEQGVFEGSYDASVYDSEFDFTGKIEQLKTDSGSYQYKADVLYDDGDVFANVYYKNGYIYRNIDEIDLTDKVKAGRVASDDFAYAVSTSFTKEDMKNATVEKLDNGGWKIVFSKKYPERLSVMDFGHLIVAEEDEGKLSVKKSLIKHTIILDKSCAFVSHKRLYNVTFDYDDDISGELGISVKQKVSVTTTVKALNTLDKITFPKDLNDYVPGQY